MEHSFGKIWTLWAQARQGRPAKLVIPNQGPTQGSIILQCYAWEHETVPVHSSDSNSEGVHRVPDGAIAPMLTYPIIAD